MDDLGKRLKALRNEQGLTLVELGNQVDLSASYLSQIERGVAMPSLARLATLARVLGVDVGFFFEHEVSSPGVVRSEQGKVLRNADGVWVGLLSAHTADRKIQPYRLVCRPGMSRDHRPEHPGEEFGFVLQGQLTVTVGDEIFVLKAGDSIHCETLQPRSWRNDGDEECIVICAISPPIAEGEVET